MQRLAKKINKKRREQQQGKWPAYEWLSVMLFSIIGGN
jgi:hypothetical protein